MGVLIIVISVTVVLASVFYTGYTIGKLTEMYKTLKFLEEIESNMKEDE